MIRFDRIMGRLARLTDHDMARVAFPVSLARTAYFFAPRLQY